MAKNLKTALIASFIGMLIATSWLFDASSFSQELSRDEIIMGQISEGLNLSAGVAAAINEFFHEHGRFPQDNSEAGIVEPIGILGKYVISVTIGAGDGSITIEYGNDADPIISGATLTLRATIKEPRPVWFCSGDYIHPKYYPINCNL